jgi:hypothetical protein
VHAPKLWLPVSPHTTDGALYLDAGKLRLAAIKPKKTSETRWESDLSDIQVKFSRGESTAMPNSRKFDAIDLDAAKFLHNDFTVIYPFNIGVTGIGAESVEIPLEKSVPSKESVAGEVSVAVGKIRLNLVDAEGESYELNVMFELFTVSPNLTALPHLSKRRARNGSWAVLRIRND